MADKCICCGKKLGILNGSHLNNQVCDNCYFPIDGYLHDIRESSNIQTIEENYDKLIQELKTSSYSDIGKEYLIKFADNLATENKNTIQKKLKLNIQEKTLKSQPVTNLMDIKYLNILELLLEVLFWAQEFFRNLMLPVVISLERKVTFFLINLNRLEIVP